MSSARVLVQDPYLQDGTSLIQDGAHMAYSLAACLSSNHSSRESSAICRHHVVPDVSMIYKCSNATFQPECEAIISPPYIRAMWFHQTIYSTLRRFGGLVLRWLTAEASAPRLDKEVTLFQPHGTVEGMGLLFVGPMKCHAQTIWKGMGPYKYQQSIFQ